MTNTMQRNHAIVSCARAASAQRSVLGHMVHAPISAAVVANSFMSLPRFFLVWLSGPLLVGEFMRSRLLENANAFASLLNIHVQLTTS